MGIPDFGSTFVLHQSPVFWSIAAIVSGMTVGASTASPAWGLVVVIIVLCAGIAWQGFSAMTLAMLVVSAIGLALSVLVWRT